MSDNKKIKLLVTYHKPSPLLNGDMFVNINGGRANLYKKFIEGKISEFDYNWLLTNTIGDDSGENISKDNDRYNELSVVYWAWKNLDKLSDPDYIGLMHYRRHFIFNKWFRLEENKWAIDFPAFDSKYIENLNISDETIQNYLNEFDCLYSCCQHDFSVYFQYEHCVNHCVEDIDFILSTIESDHPDIFPSAKKYIYGFNHYICNMFVLKKELFKQYCEFVFDVLLKYEQWRDCTNLSEIEKRFFISERITGIFIQYLIDNNKKCCPLNISYLENTIVKQEIIHAFQENNVPVVFFTDDYYVSYLGVALTSMLENIKTSCNYDIFILYNSLSDNNKKKLKNIIKSFNNVSLRFIDLGPYLLEKDIGEYCAGIDPISLSVHYRFLVADIFTNYNKILLLDSDVIINNDVAELYNLDIGNNWLGASLDIREILNIKLSEKRIIDCNRKDYLMNVLGLDDPYKFFQSGALIINIEQFKINKLKSKLFEKLGQIPDSLSKDQDILNSVCKGHVFLIPVSWNVEWQIEFERPDYEVLLPTYLFEQFSSGLKNPNIVHYASSEKPWYEPDKNLAGLWWSYARKTEFYEVLLSELLIHKLKPTLQALSSDLSEKKAISLKSIIETILSLKNSKDKSHKILTIMGIKLRIKKNNTSIDEI